MTTTLIVLALVVVAFQLYASVVVVRNGSATPHGRYYQLALIWLLPVFGAGICLLFVRSDGMAHPPTELFSDSGYDGGNDHGHDSGGGGDGH